jgi:IS1 family transposase
VGSKRNAYWIGLAMDKDTRLIIGWAIGKRDAATADELWHALPPVYRQQAVVYTDRFPAYAAVLPSKRHRPCSKRDGQTNHMERFNGTLRHRCARLVRKALSFATSLPHRVAAIWLFIHHYNAPLVAAITTT